MNNKKHMYDRYSLLKLLKENVFVNVKKGKRLR